MGLKTPIIQVVGYQNSGKTTLVAKLVENLCSASYKVGTIKHHGHGGIPQLGDSGKDTEKHRESGAEVVSVVGEGVLNLTAQADAWSLHQITELYQQLQVNLIVVEGYKKEDYPKIVLIRHVDDFRLLHAVTNIMCVISVVPLQNEYPFPLFLRTEEEEYMKFIVEQIRRIKQYDKTI